MNLATIPRGPILYEQSALVAYRTTPIRGEPAELWTLADRFREPTFVTMFEDAARFLARFPIGCVPRPIASSPTALLVTSPPWIRLDQLSHAAGARGGLAPGFVVTYLHALARELAILPATVVLRTLAPKSLAITVGGQPRLLDLTLARFEGRRAETQSGVIKGELAYMSPENIGGESLWCASDLFALGLVVFELLAGEAAFDPTPPMFEALQRIRRGAVPDLRMYREGLPDPLYALVAQLLQRVPIHRGTYVTAMRIVERHFGDQLWSGDRMLDELRALVPDAVDTAIAYGY